MIKKFFVWPIICCLLLIASSVFADDSNRAITVIPLDRQGCEGSTGELEIGVPLHTTFIWRYGENVPIENIIKVRFGLKKVSRCGFFTGETVGKCEFGNNTDGNIYFISSPADSPITRYTSDECDAGPLELDTAYRWSAMPYDQNYSVALSAGGWFTTTPLREVIYLDLDEEITPKIAGVTRTLNGVTKSHTIETIFRDANFGVDINSKPMPKPSASIGNSMGDLSAFLASVYQKPTKANQWYGYVPVTLVPKGGTFAYFGKFTGYTFKTMAIDMGGTFRKFEKKADQGKDVTIINSVVLFSEHMTLSVSDYSAKKAGMTEKQLYLRTLAHELGHALGMEGHSWGDSIFLFRKGTTIMNSLDKIGTKWDYIWSTDSLNHFSTTSLEELDPFKPPKP